MNIQFKDIAKTPIRDVEDIYKIMRLVLKRNRKMIDSSKEHFWTISLSVASEIISIEHVFTGSFRKITIDPPEVFRMPIYKQANSIVLLHNHPSGNLQPSEADKDVTNKLIQLGIMCAVEVIDHVIITERSYYSFRESGLMERLRMSAKYAPSFIYEKTVAKKIAEMRLLAERKEKAGLKVGEKVGIRKGVEKGKKTEKQEIAKQMLKKRIETNLIKDITGLPLNWIGRLQNELNKKKK